MCWQCGYFEPYTLFRHSGGIELRGIIACASARWEVTALCDFTSAMTPGALRAVERRTHENLTRGIKQPTEQVPSAGSELTGQWRIPPREGFPY